MRFRENTDLSIFIMILTIPISSYSISRINTKTTLKMLNSYFEYMIYLFNVKKFDSIHCLSYTLG